MKSLLESTDLLSEPRVVEAYWELMGKNQIKSHYIVQYASRMGSYCDKCGDHEDGHEYYSNVFCPIPGSLADVAFAMQLHVNKEMFERQLVHLYEEVAINDVGFRTYGIFVGPTQRIIAATAAWEKSHA